MFARVLFSLDVNTIYGIHIQLTIANTIENKSKNRVQKKQNGYRGENRSD